MPIISNGFIENLIDSKKKKKLEIFKEKHDQKFKQIDENNDQKIKEISEQHQKEFKKLNELNNQKFNENELILIKKQYEEKISIHTQTLNDNKDQEVKKNEEISEQEKKWHKIECSFKNNELNGIISFLLTKLNDSAVKLTGGGQTSEIHPIENIIIRHQKHQRLLFQLFQYCYDQGPKLDSI